jgi:phospholipid transport system substrate-binding protein
VGKRLGLVILVVVLSLTNLGLADKQRTGDDVVPIAGPAITPLLVVTSSMSRGVASLRPEGIGFKASEEGSDEIHRTARDLFDVGGMARRALGEHWKGLLPREQDEFVRLFGDVLGQFFVTIVERYAGDGVTVLDEAVAGTFAQVRSRIVPEQGSEIAIEYRLSQSGSRWKAYDIGLDGLSLVSNYRSQFNSIIRTSSVPHLLERMRTERSRSPQSRDALGDATSAELETPARARFAAGLLLSLAATSYARWR